MNENQGFRITSIDILRALTMLLMIFVNDLWSLKDIPGWLEHTAAEADGMGLADTVFPAFLFLVGMSIPLSVQQRRLKGDSTARIVWHILERSVALLIMGLFLVNGEYINEAATGMQRHVWNILCCTAFILLWNSWPKNTKKWLILTLKLLALIILLALAWIYRGGGEETNPHRFATHWWGILGLIGWAYLVTALVYVLSKDNFYISVFAWLLFLFTCVASHAGWIPAHSIWRTLIAPFGEGAMPAFTMGGAVTTLILLHFRKRKETGKMMVVFSILAIILFLAGIYTRQFWGISKIRATPAWVLICSAITIAVFIPVYWLADQKRKANWFKLIQPAGTNTLLCYLLPYFAYALVTLLHLYLPNVLLTAGIGLLKSFLFALLIIIMAGGLGKWGIRLKL
jgi:heparan-alpha-glucosaminide N-acetyltransferase